MPRYLGYFGACTFVQALSWPHSAHTIYFSAATASCASAPLVKLNSTSPGSCSGRRRRAVVVLLAPLVGASMSAASVLLVASDFWASAARSKKMASDLVSNFHLRVPTFGLFWVFYKKQAFLFCFWSVDGYPGYSYLIIKN